MLHSQTTLILAALMFLALPVMVWLALQPYSDRAVAWWCTGGLMAGGGIVLMGLRPWLPELVSYQIANTSVLGSLVFWAQSLRITLGQAWSVRTMALWLLLCAGFYATLLETVSPAMRGLGVRLALGLLALQTAHWAWRLSRHMRSGNAAVIALNYAILSLVLIVQGSMSALSISVPNPFSNTWDASLLALTSLVTATLAHFCYVGMMLDRAANERIEAQLALQGERQTRWLGSELRRMERRGRMAVLSGALAHELNQPLTAALMNAQLALRQWRISAQATPVLLGLLSQVQAGVDRTTQILRRIRTDSDTGWSGLRALDLNSVVQQSLSLVEPDVHRLGVTLSLSLSPTPLRCMGDEVALSQVLINLLRNALQAMSDQRLHHLQVSCSVKGDHAQLVVRDSGPGLHDTLLANWGEPLLTTKADGLGMGLAISRDIVVRHHGELTLRNHPQGGLEAMLTLPLLKEAA